MAKKMIKQYSFADLLKDFKTFLNSGNCLTIGTKSVSSYISYLKGLYQYLSNHSGLFFNGGNILDAIPSIVELDAKNGTNFASTILILIYHVPYLPTPTNLRFGKKTWQNSRSALVQLIEFLSSAYYKGHGVRASAQGKANKYVKHLFSLAGKQVYNQKH